ncbi:MAG: methyltransferase domain-containing protein [Nanoarchaeota archaeon]|mgnify:CR=1 FL=1
MNSKKLLLEQASGKKYLVKDPTKDFHTSSGTISRQELQANKEKVFSSTKKPFLLLTPSFPDLWEQLQRGPQVLIQKDIGLILAKTGVNKDSVVVDAGGGSGALCLSLANVCKEVIVYENNPEHYRVLMKNIALFGFRNINAKLEDIYQGLAEEELDLLTLDLPEPWKVTAHAEKALKLGGYLVVYSPQINQIKQLIDSTKMTRIKVLETIELLERKWKIDERVMRPEHEMLGHTGFMCFLRKWGA